jgi:TonB family protein
MKVLGLLGLALLASAPALALQETPAGKAAREAQNYDTLLKYYPARAMAAREQGLVGFKVRLDKAGQPTNCEVTHSSGHRLLDEETCQLILIHAVFKPVKDAAGNKTNQVSEGVVNWKIPGAGGAVPAAPIAVVASNAPEKMICKRELRAGTLADFERTCMTRSEWKLFSEQMKEPWEEIKRNARTRGN